MTVHRSGRMLITPEFSRWIFEKANTKVHGNPSGGNRVVLWRRTNRQTGKRTDGQKLRSNSQLSKFLTIVCTTEELGMPFKEGKIK